MLKYSLSVVYKMIFAAIVAFYALVLARFGFENFDTGYITSFTWRIVNGQSVYENFIYKGPPVTLYFNSIFLYILPETGQFFLIRIITYLLFALQVFLVVDAMDRLYHFSNLRINKWALMSVGFVVSLLNFSPYPWPTTDGILFASIAFWLLARTSRPGFLPMALVALFCILSALTKQSFYLVPLFFWFWVQMKFGFKTAIVFAAQLFFWLGIYFGFILSVTSWSNFLRQTTGETHLWDLFSVGFHNYILTSVPFFLAILAILIVAATAWIRIKKVGIESIWPAFKWISLTLFASALILCFFKEIELASRVGFNAAAVGLIYRWGFQKRNLTDLTPIVVLLGIAWSSSISLGYQFPIFCATGIIAAFLALLGPEIKVLSKHFLWIGLPVCLIAFSYNYRPYREATIPNLAYSLDPISPKLKHIRTSKTNFEKYSELKQLIGKYGAHYIVAPNIPMAHYLFGQQSELPADWLIETEVARSQKMFIRLAADKKNFIFLEKSFVTGEQFMPAQRVKFSSITEFIYQHFNCIGQTKHFLVYNALKKNETLP